MWYQWGCQQGGTWDTVCIHLCACLVHTVRLTCMCTAGSLLLPEWSMHGPHLVQQWKSTPAAGLHSQPWWSCSGHWWRKMSVWIERSELFKCYLLPTDAQTKFTSVARPHSFQYKLIKWIRRVTSFHIRHSTLQWFLWLIAKLEESFSIFKNSTRCLVLHREREKKKKIRCHNFSLHRGFHMRTIHPKCPSYNYTYRWQMTVKNLI